MTENDGKPDLNTELVESNLPGLLVAGPRKSNIMVQFMGRINRRNSAPLPVTMLIAPTGNAAERLSKLSEASLGTQHQMLDEDLEPGILKPKFW